MIAYDDVLNMNFYKKDKFTGSYRGMRYQIQKEHVDKLDVFRVINWPGPYNFTSTDDAKKTSADFPFTPEGKQQAVDWLNEQWAARKQEWPAG